MTAIDPLDYIDHPLHPGSRSSSTSMRRPRHYVWDAGAVLCQKRPMPERMMVGVR